MKMHQVTIVHQGRSILNKRKYAGCQNRSISGKKIILKMMMKRLYFFKTFMKELSHYLMTFESPILYKKRYCLNTLKGNFCSFLTQFHYFYFKDSCVTS